MSFPAPALNHQDALYSLPRGTTWRGKTPAWWSKRGLGGYLAVLNNRSNPLQLKEKGNYLVVGGGEREGVM